ncbi:MAG: phosphopentomutase [Clostridia bacterium]|nr:phosphopentomutase [Clostridia bacterium]
MFKRVFIIVLDSFGIGEMPDSAAFGDSGSNTLAAIAKSSLFKVPNLQKAGLFNIDGVTCGKKCDTPTFTVGRMKELSGGKDTTIGHWEIAGLVSEKAMPTFPNGFPEAFITDFEKATGRKCICNKPYSGTKVIADYGEEHIKSGALIVYTSADSVFQIAAHENIVPIETLYEYCETARKMLVGDLAVGRVIARPFTGEYPFTRTSNRHDFSLEPTGKTVLDKLKENSFDVISIGKIYDIFAGRGMTENYRTVSNADGMQKTLEAAKREFNGLCFTNLVDFDMLYGHRNDVDGYAKALSEFDAWLPQLMAELDGDDLLIITADHGCDPSTPSTDHSREYVPLLVWHKNIKPANLATLDGFSHIGETVEEIFLKTEKEKSFLSKL